MYQIKFIDEFIYNHSNDIALKLSSKSVFAGDNIYSGGGYPYFEVWLMQSPTVISQHHPDTLKFSRAMFSYFHRRIAKM